MKGPVESVTDAHIAGTLEDGKRLHIMCDNSEVVLPTMMQCRNVGVNRKQCRYLESRRIGIQKRFMDVHSSPISKGLREAPLATLFRLRLEEIRVVAFDADCIAQLVCHIEVWVA